MHSDNKPLLHLLSVLTAMSITGNKDFKTAKRYYKAVDILKADEISKVFG